MCGIFIMMGFANWLATHDAEHDIVRSVGETLIAKGTFLEYRGSQSVGMAIRTRAEASFLEKVVFEDKKERFTSRKLLPPLQAHCDGRAPPAPAEQRSVIGMIHTRWPTDGAPKHENAQPMLSEERGMFTLVLNGIIANADELRAKIDGAHGDEGRLTTDTDTEVVARLFYETYRKNRAAHEKDPRVALLDFEAICRHVTDACKGRYAIAVMSEHFPGELVAYANKTLLCLGLESACADFRACGKDRYFLPGDGYFELSSDPRILTDRVEGYLKLERCDIVKISSEGVLLDRNTDPLHGEECRAGSRAPRARAPQDDEGYESEYDEEWDDEEQPEGIAQVKPGWGSAKLKSKDAPVLHRHRPEEIKFDFEEGVLAREIGSQPQCLAEIIGKRLEGGRIVFGELERRMLNTLARRRRFYFVGCGSSYNVGLSVKQAFNDFVGAEVSEVLNAMMLVDQMHPVVPRESVYIFISQSGTTGDTNTALEYCLARSALCIALTNTRQSIISDTCHATIDVMAGFEQAIASTKAYTCQYIQLCLLAALIGQRRLEMYRATMRRLGERPNPLPAVPGSSAERRCTRPYPPHSLSDERVRQMESGLDAFVSEAAALPGKVEEAMECSIDRLVRYMAKSENKCLFLLSHGTEYATAVEAGLKITEVTQINTMVYYSSELMHGPLASINPGARVVMIEPSDQSVQNKLRGAVKQVQTTGAAPLVVCTSVRSLKYYQRRGVRRRLLLPQTYPLLQGIVTAVPFQRAARRACELLGNSPDVLPNLAKSITVVQDPLEHGEESEESAYVDSDYNSDRDE